MTLAHSERQPNRAVAAFLDAVGRPGVPLAIDAGDEMLGQLLATHHGSVDVGLVGYFRTGWMAAEALERALRWRFGESAPIRLLDFASGYGRVTRFLVPERDRLAITVADVDPDAVEFQRRTFAVDGLVTTHSPQSLDLESPGTGTRTGSLDTGATFDAIFVASLFSHLPEATFTPWLGSLYRRLAPGGILVLSTHGVETLLPGREMPAGGHFFDQVKVARRLEPGDYGSTWVSEEFVSRAIREVSGGCASYRRFPRALWHSQDLYVIVPEGGADLSELSLAGGPEGYLYSCYPETPTRLAIAGWAADRAAPGRGVEIAVALNGRTVATVESSRPFPDARPDLGEAADRAAWELRIDLDRPLSPADDMLVVSARSEIGASVLHAGTVEVTSLYLNLARARREIEALRSERDGAFSRHDELDAAVRRLGWEKHLLEERIAAMRRSRFWRLREGWFRLTGRADGL